MPKISQYPSQSGASVANGDLIPIVDVGSPNVTERITVAEFAQAPQFSSRYAPLADTVWVPAQAMIVQQGSPTLGKIGASDLSPAWLLDADAVAESVGGSVALPPWWATWHADVWIANAGAGAGDATLRLYYSEVADGSALTNLGVSAGVDCTVGAEDVVKVFRLFANRTYSDGVVNFLLQRQGSMASDTLTNDVGVIGIQFVRAS